MVASYCSRNDYKYRTLKDATRLQNLELSRSTSSNLMFPESRSIKEAASCSVEAERRGAQDSRRDPETQSSAQLAGMPLPLNHDLSMSMGHCRPLHLGQSLPYGMTPVISTYPTEHLARNFRDGFRQGLLSGGILGFLEHMPLLSYVRPAGSNAGGLVGVLGKVISSIPILNNILDIRVTNPQLLEIGLVQSYDYHRLYVTIPLGFELKVNTLMVGSLVELAVKLDVTAEVYAVRDFHGRSRLVIGDCIYSPGSLRITLLNGLSPLQSLIDSLTDILTKVIPGLVQGVVCPVVNGILGLLDVTLVHDVAGFVD